MKKAEMTKMKIFEYVKDRVADGLPPTVREICQALGIRSTSTVHRHLQSLAEEGYIEKAEGLNRAIGLPHESFRQIPVLGKVTAGLPILAVEQYAEEYIPFPKNKARSRDLFALRIQGTSMIEAGILDGDVVVVERTPSCDNGDIVVALLGEEATVKRLYKEKNRIRLQPENSTMEPIYVNEVTVLGKVVGCVRYY